VRRRFPCVDARWRNYIAGAVYIPLVAEKHLAVLQREGSNAFLDELARLAKLGSPWASAILGYRALLLQPDGTRDVERAILLCKQAAASGDAYAAYVFGWAIFLRGDQAEAVSYIKRAALKMFPPALLALISLSWGSQSRTEPKRVLISLQQAKATGHFAVPHFRSQIYRTGKLGLARMLFGYIAAPVAYLYLGLASWRHPFCAQAFAFDIRTPSKAFALRD
jgi:hypothetical protein